MTQAEWDAFGAARAASQSNVIALRPGGTGDVTETHLAWKGLRGIPEMPSPLLYRGRLWFVRDGGMVTSYEPATGRVVLNTPAPRESEASTRRHRSAAGGRIYAASVDGTITVFEARDTLEVARRGTSSGNGIVATPALGSDTLYVRTEKHLWAFR